MGAIADFLAADHDRLDALLSSATADPGRVDLAAYEAFRRGLLKHVGMEELILFAAARRLTGSALPAAVRARAEHGALTALLIPTPTPKLLALLRSLLGPHNVMEEEAGGLYARCEEAVGPEAGAVLERLRAAPDIPPAAHVDGPHVLASIDRALAAAGFPARLSVGAGSVILGATGLVGRAVAALLAARGGPVVALTRRPVGLPGVTERVVDFSRPEAAAEGLVGRDLYCCLGTTLKKAGSPEAFRAVDHDLPLALMRAAAARGFARLFLVSSAGADARSAFLYNRVKGELEAAASALPFEAVHIARPSLLLGARSESRPAEAFAQALAPYLGPLLPARLRPISAEAVARALLRLADEGASGVHVHESDALVRLAAGL